jgi:integrase
MSFKDFDPKTSSPTAASGETLQPNTPSVAAPARANIAMTAAQAIAAVEQARTLSPRLLRECRSAVNTVSKMLRREPDEILIAPVHFREALNKTINHRAGRSKSRMYNIKSGMKTLAIAVGLHAPDEVCYCAPSATWVAILAALATDPQRMRLSRFASWCTANKIEPADVTDQTVEAFESFMRELTYAENLTLLCTNLRREWNRAAGVVPGWPWTKLTRKPNKNAIALPLEEFPMSFQEDLKAFLEYWEAPRDMRHRLATGKHAPRTVEAYRGNLMRAASIVVKLGTPIAEVTSIACIVQPTVVDRILTYLDSRVGNEKAAPANNMAGCLCLTAEFWVKVPETDLETLRRYARASHVKRDGLSDKTRLTIMELMTPERLRRLLHLPAKLAADARELLATAPMRALVMMENAIAIELLIYFPVRRDTLARLKVTDFVRTERGRIDALFVSSERVKNRMTIEGKIGDAQADLLREYFTKYRPLRSGATNSEWLFPGEKGGHMAPDWLGKRISAVLEAELGVRMTLHTFRHLAASIVLDANPDAIGTAQALLAHKSHKTTDRKYGVLRQRGVSKRYGDRLNVQRKTLGKPKK